MSIELALGLVFAVGTVVVICWLLVAPKPPESEVQQTTLPDLGPDNDGGHW